MFHRLNYIQIPNQAILSTRYHSNIIPTDTKKKIDHRPLYLITSGTFLISIALNLTSYYRSNVKTNHQPLISAYFPHLIDVFTNIMNFIQGRIQYGSMGSAQPILNSKKKFYSIEKKNNNTNCILQRSGKRLGISYHWSKDHFLTCLFLPPFIYLFIIYFFVFLIAFPLFYP